MARFEIYTLGEALEVVGEGRDRDNLLDLYEWADDFCGVLIDTQTNEVLAYDNENFTLNDVATLILKLNEVTNGD